MTLKTEPFVLNFGPMHPSTHGVYRMRATLDGEVVLDIEPIFGYLHRGIEKLAGIKVPERAEYIRVIMAELQRIANHCIAVGAFLNDCGAFFTPFLYLFW